MIRCCSLARLTVSPRCHLQRVVRRANSTSNKSSHAESQGPSPTTSTTTTTKADGSHNHYSSNWLWPAASIAAMGVTYILLERALHPNDRRSISFSSSNHPSLLSPAPPQAEITDRAFLDIAIDGQAIGRIVLGLHGTVAPKTVDNFIHLCQGDRSDGNLRLAYENSTFHRIIPSFMIQGGDFVRHNGTGGRSIYGRSFADEIFVLRHQVGVLSMANSGKDTNGSQFFITLAATPHLDSAHVVFGTVLEGWEVVKAIEDCGSPSGRPSGSVKIVTCGLLPKDE